MSKRVYFFGLAVIAVALAFVLADQLFWEPGVSASNVRRIRPGMTLEEVKTILGGPNEGYEHELAGWKRAAKSIAERVAEVEESLTRFEDLRQRLGFFAAVIVKAEEKQRFDFEKFRFERIASRGEIDRVWRSDQGRAVVRFDISVLFDTDGRVVSATFEPNPHLPQRPLERVRSWLGW
jgi:hypothetical protein